MDHPKRLFGVKKVASVKMLSAMLAKRPVRPDHFLCAGFELSHKGRRVLVLNDSLNRCKVARYAILVHQAIDLGVTQMSLWQQTAELVLGVAGPEYVERMLQGALDRMGDKSVHLVSREELGDAYLGEVPTPAGKYEVSYDTLVLASYSDLSLDYSDDHRCQLCS